MTIAPARAHSFPPRLMKEPDAAYYIGTSASTLRKLEIPRRVLGGLRLYDIRDLDDYASSLPIEGESETCAADAIWGRSA